MKPINSAKVKYGIWGLFIGAVIAMIVGFAWGGWITSGTSEKKTTEAVLASQVSICIAQFAEEPNYEELLKELKEISSWQRDEFIKKGGWDKMPGQKDADYNVAQACAEGLELLI